MVAHGLIGAASIRVNVERRPYLPVRVRRICATPPADRLYNNTPANSRITRGRKIAAGRVGRGPPRNIEFSFAVAVRGVQVLGPPKHDTGNLLSETYAQIGCS
ncbi:hypothetical protein Trydic_g7024 [Trypoxylus dichotomus]